MSLLHVLSALYRVKPVPSKDFYAKVADRLVDVYWRQESSTPPFAVIDATIHAATMSGHREPVTVSPFIRVSSMYRGAQDSYNREDYNSALQFARKGQQLGSVGTDVRAAQLREIVYKSLLKMRMWPEAEKELRIIETSSDRRYFFLKGFGLRMRGKLPDALNAYQSALEVGDNRVAVHREMAFCMTKLGDYKGAVNACNKEHLKGRPITRTSLIVWCFLPGDERLSEGISSAAEIGNC